MGGELRVDGLGGGGYNSRPFNIGGSGSSGMTIRTVFKLAAMGLGVVALTSATGCSSQKPAATLTAPKVVATPDPEETPVPTVPPRAKEAPAAAAKPEETSGSEAPSAGVAEAKAQSGAGTGPVITYFGAARADGKVVPAASVDKDGVEVYTTAGGSGFILVVEARPGKSGLPPGRQVSAHDPKDPNRRPDVELQSNRDLGDGSKRVCDRRRPIVGGIPAINPPSWANTQSVADALNDIACRFETFIESEMSCTLDKLGNFSFANTATTTQFCVLVAKSFQFPEGVTELQVRVRDTGGNVGPVKKIRIRRPPAK